jgi:hypothetical protein
MHGQHIRKSERTTTPQDGEGKRRHEGGAGPRSGLRLIELAAGRRADGLRLAQQLARFQLSARPVLAAQETRHGGGTECARRGEGGARYFGAVAQAAGIDGGLGIVLGQNELLGS